MTRPLLLIALLLFAVLADAQTIPTVDNLSRARAQWQHDKVNLSIFEYLVDGQPRPELLIGEVGPSPIAGYVLFQARLPSDLQPGAHSYQVRGCNVNPPGGGAPACSGFLIVPFTLLADGTIVPPNAPTGGTVIQVTVAVTIKP